MIHWNSLADFVAMGGYAGYVWGSFGVAALIMVVEPVMAVRRRTRIVARVKRQLRADACSGNESPRTTTQ